AIFSVVDGILFRPLPYDHPEELVAVWLDVTRRGGPIDEWPNYPAVQDLVERSRSVEAAGIWHTAAVTLTGRRDPEQLSGAAVSQDMFSTVLTTEPVLGRGFTAEDDRPGAPGTLLLSHGLWVRAFGGDEDVVGSTLTLNGQPYSVIGVMPRGFHPPFVPNAAFWTPVRWSMSDNGGCGRGGYCVRAVARLAEGVDPDDALIEARAIGDQLAAEYPETNTDQTYYLRPLREDLVGPARAALLVLMGAAGLVLLIVCVNVANLLLARGTARRSELAVRSALGARRGRLTAQLLAESLVLAICGGVLGIVLAYGLTDLLIAISPPGTPRIDEVAVNGRILAFAASVSVLAGLLFGALPAIRSAGADVHDALREAGRGSDRVTGARARSALVVVQVALALVMLVGSGLLVRTSRNLQAMDMGFRAEGVLALDVSLPSVRYGDRASFQSFFPGLLERLEALPGVEATGATTALPLAFNDSDVNFNIEGRPLPTPGREQTVWFRRVTPGFLATMGTPIVAGRGILPTDVDGGARVVVVNETFLRRYFPDGDAVGSRMNLGNPERPVWREIVGVARDTRQFGLREDSRAALYLPVDQSPTRFMSVVVRSSRDPAQLAPEARRVLAEMDPLLAAGRMGPFQDLVDDAMGSERLVTTLIGLFGALALVLALVGLYGVVSYSVSSRMKEMGVRLALGASGGEVERLVVRRSLILVSIGLAVGLLAAFGATRLLESLLFGVTPTDPMTFVMVGLILAATSTAAAAIPAARAARVDPVRVLTAE
ncbi:MAG: ABC transporter permease, partial [Gemmatimonadota bacterium]